MPALNTARARPAPPRVNAATTPGEYMRGCREAAGLSVARAAQAIASGYDRRGRARDEMEAMEANRPSDYGRLVQVLRDRKVFPFDFGTFVELCAATASPDLDEPDPYAAADWEH